MNTEIMQEGIDKEQHRNRDRWHVGREVPIAVLLMLFVQTGGGIWWLAQMSAKIESAVSSLTEFKAERYTKEDARQNKELFLVVVDSLRQDIVELKRRVNNLEVSNTYSKGK